MTTVLEAAQMLDEEYVVEKILTILGDGDKANEIIKRMNADELERGKVIAPTEPEEEEETPEE